MKSNDDRIPPLEKNQPRLVLLEVNQHVTPEPRIHYINHNFIVPTNASRVGLELSFHKDKLAQIFISLHDPQIFRGNRMNPGAKGDIVLDLWVSPDQASEGATPGALPTGEWRAQIDIERLNEEVEYRLIAYAEFSPVPEAEQPQLKKHIIVRPGIGWYKGELHAHSTESDGKYPVATVVQAALDAGLDFLSLTDHFTNSQWRKLDKLEQQTQIALIHSLEITSHQGHANLQGLQDWVDVYVDRPDWSINQAAESTHDQGGLFCINHAFSGDLAWRSFDFSWDNADLIEIYHNLEGANNNFHPGLWDMLLVTGYRIIGVAGTDSHDPFTGTDRINQVVTWVYADELSEKGIVAGLKRGNVYMSRGPEMRFEGINSDGDHVSMGENLEHKGAPVTLDIKVKAEQPLRLFVFRNGLLFDSQIVNGDPQSWHSVSVTDNHPPESGFYRLEFHSVFKHPQHPGIYWRDYTTMQVMSNPIWVM